MCIIVIDRVNNKGEGMRMDRKELYYQTACITGMGQEEIEQFCYVCYGGDESALNSITPKELAFQINEYLGV